MPYSVRETILMSSESFHTPGSWNQTEVFAVHGADPEILAYAMAKYSRSALSMRESLAEISSQRAEQFLNTFYFQYGHRSIADLAHIAFAIERLSLLAAIVLVDEPRWDGQERSTRYQNFVKSGWYLPDFGQDAASRQLYTQTVENLFAAYERTSAAVLEVMRGRAMRPESIKPEALERILRARAFDVARYLLPLATNTSLGQIVSARTLEGQVSRLLSHPAAEVRNLGAKLRDAATAPAWNLNAEAAQAFVEKLAAEEATFGPRTKTAPPRRDTSWDELDPLGPPKTAESAAKPPEESWGYLDPLGPPKTAENAAKTGEKPAEAVLPSGNLAAEAADLFTRDVLTAPTLVKYAQPNEYLMDTQADLAEVASKILGNVPITPAPTVDLVERTESLEVELAATLLYSASHHPYRQIRDLVASWTSARVAEVIEIGLRRRGKHDETLRVFHAGAALRFDILMDIGGFRDMHRHRRCTQIIQGFTSEHGYESPGPGDLGSGADILAEAGIESEFRSAIESAHQAAATIAAGPAPEGAQTAIYLFPLATRVRALFKMDFAEAQYISELRSSPAGHFSYRRVAWEMYLALEDRHPSLARHIRVTDFTKPIDIFQR
jgi:thymidylate synthase ThyX